MSVPEHMEEALSDLPEHLRDSDMANYNRNLDEEDPQERIVEEAVKAALTEKTPEGVPENAEYIPPNQEPPEGFETVEGPQGATYAVREGEAEETASDAADDDSDGTEDEDDVEYIETEYGRVPDTEGPIPPDMRDEPIGSDSHPVLWKRPEGEEELNEYISEIQDTEWYGEGSEIFDAAFHGDDNTENEYTDEDGNWDEQRLAKHDEWTEDLLNEDAATAEGEEPIGMVLLGPPGAGKGWWQEQAGEGAYGETGEFTEREFTHISSDETKEPIPEYEGSNASEVHDEASKMAKDELAPKATERQHNMVVDKVATSPDSTLTMIERMQEQGYDIRASFVDVPTEKAVFNAVSRYYEEGRFTPLDFVNGADQDSRESFEEIVEQADIPEEKVGRFNNDVEWGESPDVEEMGEDLLKFYKRFYGWDPSENQTYKTIGEEDGTDGRTSRSRRDERGDRGVDGGELQRGAGGGNGSRRRSQRRRISDIDWDSPINAEKTLSRVRTPDVVDSPTKTKKIRVVSAQQVPSNKLAKSDDEGLYYNKSVNHVPDRWKSFVDKTPSTLTQKGEEVIDALERTYREQVWPDDLEKSPVTWDGDDTVTEELKSWIPEVFKEMDPLHGDYDGVPMLAAMRVQNEIEASLTQPQGWSLNSVAKRLTDEFDWMDRTQAEGIARQEVSAVLNTAKSVMYRAAEPVEDTWLFRWEGPDDQHTSDICREVKEEINQRGGAVPYDVLEDILREKAKEYEGRGGTPWRVQELIPHFKCRHTIELESR